MSNAFLAGTGGSQFFSAGSGAAALAFHTIVPADLTNGDATTPDYDPQLAHVSSSLSAAGLWTFTGDTTVGNAKGPDDGVSWNYDLTLAAPDYVQDGKWMLIWRYTMGPGTAAAATEMGGFAGVIGGAFDGGDPAVAGNSAGLGGAVFRAAGWTSSRTDRNGNFAGPQGTDVADEFLGYFIPGGSRIAPVSGHFGLTWNRPASGTAGNFGSIGPSAEVNTLDPLTGILSFLWDNIGGAAESMQFTIEVAAAQIIP